MNKKLAERVAKLISDGIEGSGQFRLVDSRPSGIITDFHQWANDRPAFGGFLVKKKGDGKQLWLLIIDWNPKNAENYYCVIYPAPKPATTLAELHKAVQINAADCLCWNYSPVKRDGRNKQRKQVFLELHGSTRVEISLPAELADVDDFLSNLFHLVDCRQRADSLAGDGPQTKLRE